MNTAIPHPAVTSQLPTIDANGESVILEEFIAAEKDKIDKREMKYHVPLS